MSFVKSLNYIFLAILAFTFNSLYANDNTSLGVDHSRKLILKMASESNDGVSNKYNTLLNTIKNSQHLEDDDHKSTMVNSLVAEQQRWLDYRSAHCQLQSNIYIFPVYSRMWISNYNSCLIDMNKARIKFLDDITLEYKK